MDKGRKAECFKRDAYSAPGITINYSPSDLPIDALNRVRKRTYSNGDPAVTYAYDGNAPSGCSPTLSITYGIGRRTGMCDAAGNEAWSYDKMGRVAIDQRTTNSVTKTTTYSTPSVPYNFDGSVAQLTYPSGRTITYTPNSAAQPVSAVDTANNINYATMALYAPQGALRSLLNGNGTGILSTLYYNNRLQPCRIAVNSSGAAPGSCGDGTSYGNVLDYNYNFNLGASDNGNVIAITNNLTKNTPTDRSQSFTYDVLNRIATAGTVSTSGANCWGEQYGYDAWGNLLSMAGITPQYKYNGCSQESGFSITVNANNQIAGFCYDAAGNLLAESAPPCPSPTYTYNAENQLTLTAGVTYTYDGDGKRVEKSSGKLYWYGMSSDPLDETDANGNITDEYVFFGGKRIARRDSSGNVDYYFADHVGTARVVTNATGTVPPLDDSDFYPFGGQRALLSSSGNTYKFTGKERDSESGLDNFGARYDSPQYGRFMTPDPAGKQSAVLSNPQTWNRYSYVLNNPLRLVDPSGRFPTDAHIYWGVIALGHVGFTGDAARLSRVSNSILDQGYFFTDRLHALAGDAAFRAAKSQLFSMALDSKRSDGERGLAVMAGMHLVEDYQAHKGLVGPWAHAKKYDKYPFDANPDSKEGRQALVDALHFVDAVKGALSNSLGDEAGQAKLNEMLNAAENLFNTDMVWGAMNDISQGVSQNAADSTGIGAPNFSPMLQEEENRQCGLGNRAACN